jgi:hypothetical protein
LYFATDDGRPGLGGLDIYVSKIEKFSFKEVRNVGAPINGTQMILLLIDSKSRSGFTSNRDGGKGYDDIWLPETKIRVRNNFGGDHDQRQVDTCGLQVKFV